MIVELFLIYGTWAILNGTYAHFKDENLTEFVYRLVITWGIVTILYGVNLLLKL